VQETSDSPIRQKIPYPRGVQAATASLQSAAGFTVKAISRAARSRGFSGLQPSEGGQSFTGLLHGFRVIQSGPGIPVNIAAGEFGSELARFDLCPKRELKGHPH